MLLLAEHEKSVRRRAPYAGVGKTVVVDGPVVRVHAGTHGEVHLVGPVGPDPGGLARRLQEAFAVHGERVEWKVYGHDDPTLAPALLDCGFTAGWERPLLIAPIDSFRGPVPDGVREVALEGYQQARQVARTGGPHRDSLDELDADGVMPGDLCVLTRTRRGHRVDVGWAQESGEFIVIGGLIGDPADFLAYWTAWSPRPSHRRLGARRQDLRLFVAEVDGSPAEALKALGFREVSTVRTYHWSPPGRRPQTRPVRTLLGQPEYGEIWTAVEQLFSFAPSVTRFPGIVEPSPSVTWAFGGRTERPAETVERRLEEIVERGLRAVVRPGELLRFLDWNHAGVEYDPARVGRPEYPEWQGLAYPDGDYYLNVTPDLRLGTFGHPWEHTLCVFGAGLLAEIEDDLTALLGAAIRRT